MAIDLYDLVTALLILWLVLGGALVMLLMHLVRFVNRRRK